MSDGTPSEAIEAKRSVFSSKEDRFAPTDLAGVPANAVEYYGHGKDSHATKGTESHASMDWFPMRMPRFFIYLWVLPTSLVGLMFLLPTLLTGGGANWVEGVLEIRGGLAGFFLRRGTLLKGGASAMTLGHVVIGRDAASLQWSRAHERVHVRQCERWGPLFIPAYLIASVVMWMRGGQAYRDNPFEREAYNEAP